MTTTLEEIQVPLPDDILLQHSQQQQFKKSFLQNMVPYTNKTFQELKQHVAINSISKENGTITLQYDPSWINNNQLNTIIKSILSTSLATGPDDYQHIISFIIPIKIEHLSTFRLYSKYLRECMETWHPGKFALKMMNHPFTNGIAIVIFAKEPHYNEPCTFNLMVWLFQAILDDMKSHRQPRFHCDKMHLLSDPTIKSLPWHQQIRKDIPLNSQLLVEKIRDDFYETLEKEDDYRKFQLVTPRSYFLLSVDRASLSMECMSLQGSLPLIIKQYISKKIILLLLQHIYYTMQFDIQSTKNLDIIGNLVIDFFHFMTGIDHDNLKQSIAFLISDDDMMMIVFRKSSLLQNLHLFETQFRNFMKQLHSLSESQLQTCSLKTLSPRSILQLFQDHNIILRPSGPMSLHDLETMFKNESIQIDEKEITKILKYGYIPIFFTLQYFMLFQGNKHKMTKRTQSDVHLKIHTNTRIRTELEKHGLHVIPISETDPRTITIDVSNQAFDGKDFQSLSRLLHQSLEKAIHLNSPTSSIYSIHIQRESKTKSKSITTITINIVFAATSDPSISNFRDKIMDNEFITTLFQFILEKNRIPNLQLKRSRKKKITQIQIKEQQATPQSSTISKTQSDCGEDERTLSKYFSSSLSSPHDRMEYGKPEKCVLQQILSSYGEFYSVGSAPLQLTTDKSDLDYIIVQQSQQQRRRKMTSIQENLRSTSKQDIIKQVKHISKTVNPILNVKFKSGIQADISAKTSSEARIMLSSIAFIRQAMNEHPLLKPLILILKTYLQNTSFINPNGVRKKMSDVRAGGLSSYGLQLMILYYLLLAKGMDTVDVTKQNVIRAIVGFLDFYANKFKEDEVGIQFYREQLTNHILPGSITIPITDKRRRKTVPFTTFIPLVIYDPVNPSYIVTNGSFNYPLIKKQFHILSTRIKSSSKNQLTIMASDFDNDDAGSVAATSPDSSVRA